MRFPRTDAEKETVKVPPKNLLLSSATAPTAETDILKASPKANRDYHHLRAAD